MFLGHFGVAFAAKKAAPKASLGMLVLGAQLADLLWPIFLLFDWEQVRIDPGNTRFTPLDFISYPYSHSLVAELLLGAALGGIYFALRKNARHAVVAGLCVPTHWLLDWIAHRPDMPIFPGGTRHGLGMWNSVPVTLAVEFALFAAGIAVYLGVTRKRDRIGLYALWSMIVFLLVAYLGFAFGPPPSSVHTLALSGLGMWLIVPWAAWADAHRESI